MIINTKITHTSTANVLSIVEDAEKRGVIRLTIPVKINVKNLYDSQGSRHTESGDIDVVATVWKNSGVCYMQAFYFDVVFNFMVLDTRLEGNAFRLTLSTNTEVTE